MFYAIRTIEIYPGIRETHGLTFYTRRHRDEFCQMHGADPITAKENRGLMRVGLRYGRVSEGGFVFFSQRVLERSEDVEHLDG